MKRVFANLTVAFGFVAFVGLLGGAVAWSNNQPAASGLFVAGIIAGVLGVVSFVLGERYRR